MNTVLNGTGGVLYRLHFRRRPVSATSGMIWAHTAKWVFRQTPKGTAPIQSH